MGVRRRRARRNPLLAVLNRPTPIGRGVRAIEYEEHATHGKGPWRHKYRRGDFSLFGLPSGDVLVKAKDRAAWSRDGSAGWLDNPKHKALPPGISAAEFVAIVDKVGPRAAAMALRWNERTVRKMYERIVKTNRGGTMARKRKHKRKSKRRPPKGFGSWAAYMASIRPGGRKTPKRRSNPMSRRRRRTRHNRGRRRRPRVAHVIVNRHRGRRRHFSRNPGGLVGRYLNSAKRGFLVLGGKVVARAVPAMIGIQPIGYLGVGVQTLVGGAAAFLLGNFVNWNIAEPFLDGVFASAYESLARGANIAFLSPALSDETELHALAGLPSNSARLPGGGSPLPGVGDTGSYPLGSYPGAERGMGDSGFEMMED